jgi:thiol-disulfide isomerase/thioredoxin
VVKGLLYLLLWVLSLSAMAADSDSSSRVELTAVDPTSSSINAPTVELYTLQGNRIELNEYQGKVSLIHFWATWCIPCVKELPDIEHLQNTYVNKPLRIVAIAADNHEAVNSFIKKHNNKLSVFIDQYGNAMRYYNIKAFPTSIIVDKNGKVRYQAIGQVTWQDKKVLAKIEGLLSE